MARQTSFAWLFILLFASISPTANLFAQTPSEDRWLEFPPFSIKVPKWSDWRQMVLERDKFRVGMDEEVIWAVLSKSLPAIEKSGEPLQVMTQIILGSKKIHSIPDNSQGLLANEVRGLEERHRKKSNYKNLSLRTETKLIGDSNCLQYFFTYEDHQSLGALSPIYDATTLGLICVNSMIPSSVVHVFYNEKVLQGHSSLSSVEQEAKPLIGSLVIHKKLKE